MKKLIDPVEKATHLADRMAERLGDAGDIKIDADASLSNLDSVMVDKGLPREYRSQVLDAFLDIMTERGYFTH